MDINKFIAIGNMTRDIELRYSGEGKAFGRFGLAINRGYGDNKKTSFINCVAFGKTAEAMANFTTKGSKICIDAEVQTGDYTNKEGVKIYTTDFIINNVQFLSQKETGQAGGNKPTYFNDAMNDDEDIFQPIDDDEEIPF